MSYRILDAKDGLMEAGTVDVRALRTQQPWGGEAVADGVPTGASMKGLRRQSAAQRLAQGAMAAPAAAWAFWRPPPKP
jgi:hypothetical protein